MPLWLGRISQYMKALWLSAWTFSYPSPLTVFVASRATEKAHAFGQFVHHIARFVPWCAQSAKQHISPFLSLVPCDPVTMRILPGYLN